MSASPDIMALSATDLSAAILERRISCVAVMEACLAQIAEHNPQVNAIVSLREDGALLSEAQIRDDELAAGKSRGWMHGFPQAIKDLSDAKGLRTSFGSRISPKSPAVADEIFVSRIKASGAIIIGKTNVPEFGLGSHTYNDVFGTTLNAFDRSKSAGGSSGGAAVALATHMLPVADGSDMMGSLRNPAGFNGVVGFRPTVGRIIDRRDDRPFQPALGTSGPMARTVTDCAHLYGVMADRPVAALAPCVPRLAWLGDLGGYLAMEPGVLDLCETALDALRTSGIPVDPVTIDFSFAALWDAWLTLRQAEIASLLRTLLDVPQNRARMKPELIWELEQAQSLDAKSLAPALACRDAWCQVIDRLFERYDGLVLPSAQVFPFDATLHWPDRIDGRGMDTYHRWMEVVIPATLYAGPTIAVPAGLNPAGLPLGLQIMGKRDTDETLLATALAVEQAL